MAVKGVFLSNQNIQGTEVGSFSSALLTVMPTGSAQLLALSAGMKSRDISASIHHWFEETHMAGRASVTNNAGTGTSIVVDDAGLFVPGVIFLVETTGEYIFVEDVSGLTLTVTRGFADTTAQAIDGSVTPVPIQRIQTAHEEASNRPIAIANIGVSQTNFVSNFRNSWDVSKTTQAIQYHTGDLPAKNRADAASLHAEDIERGLLHGRKSIGVLNNRVFRTMDGIVTQIKTNVQAQGASVNLTDLNTFFRNVFSRNIKGQPNERIGFIGNIALDVLNEIARIESQVNIQVGQTDFGLEIITWRTPHGTIKFMTHPLMNESPLWQKDMYVFHPGAFTTLWLRRTQEDRYDKDGTRAGVDADFGVFTSELTCEYAAEITGGIFTGLDTAVAV